MLSEFRSFVFIGSQTEVSSRPKDLTSELFPSSNTTVFSLHPTLQIKMHLVKLFHRLSKVFILHSIVLVEGRLSTRGFTEVFLAPTCAHKQTAWYELRCETLRLKMWLYSSLSLSQLCRGVGISYCAGQQDKLWRIITIQHNPFTLCSKRSTVRAWCVFITAITE